MSIASAGWKHIETTSCLLLIAIITTILRICSRRRVRLAVGADDWSLWIALGFVCAIYVEGLICESCLEMMYPSAQIPDRRVTRGRVWRRWKALCRTVTSGAHCPFQGRCWLLTTQYSIVDSAIGLSRLFSHIPYHLRRHQAFNPPPLHAHLPRHPDPHCLHYRRSPGLGARI